MTHSASVRIPSRRDPDGAGESTQPVPEPGAPGSTGKSTSYRNLCSFMALSNGTPLMNLSFGSSARSRSFTVLPEILGGLSEPAMVVNTDSGVIFACNVRCARLLESEPDDIAGRELKDVVMLVNPLEAGETVECFFINGKGQCLRLILGVTAHPFVEGLFICTLVLDDNPNGSGELDMGASSLLGDHDDRPSEFVDDETGEGFRADFKKFLGEGGSGSVCEGTWGASERIAVKFIACNNRAVLESQYQEVRTLQELQHANIVQYKGSAVLKDEDTIVVALEFADHGSLQTLVEGHRPIAPDTLREYFADALHALSYVHASGIVHRDVKPSNLLLCSGPERVVCKLTDFGSAIRKDLLKSQNPFLGTPAFMAPEQFEGRVGYYSDVWAIGVSALFCVLRRAPYPPDLVCNPLRLMFAIVDGLRPTLPLEGPEELLDVARCTLIDSPLERPSIAEVLQRLTGEVVPGESSEPITSPLTRDALQGRLTRRDSGAWDPVRILRSGSPPPKRWSSFVAPSLPSAAALRRCVIS